MENARKARDAVKRRGSPFGRVETAVRRIRGQKMSGKTDRDETNALGCPEVYGAEASHRAPRGERSSPVNLARRERGMQEEPDLHVLVPWRGNLLAVYPF